VIMILNSEPGKAAFEVPLAAAPWHGSRIGRSRRCLWRLR